MRRIGKTTLLKKFYAELENCL
ncbi:MAG: hypothetical protein GF332_01230 [Candidatus Moranbacteria bacterium]|nr:hypothetical protein [Candidatus Moranbacteria bacterium]